MPTDTLTFLFTDIEGSTALLRRVGGDIYSGLLADHHAIIRAGLEAHGGKEIGTQGDGFFAVFASATACVAAVVEMQRSLSSKSWPAGERVRVRMGIHTGEAAETTTGLVGFEAHRAARVAAVAHGGQVVLSTAAAALVRDSLPLGSGLRDLGPHRLKDLGSPEEIFQLEAEGLESDFPPLRSLDNPELPNNLPAHLSTFVGRGQELAEVRSLVEGHRLVTLCGSGGSGKTRLALQVAAELVDGAGEGVWFADLSTVVELDQVPGVILGVLGVRDEGGEPPLERLIDILRTQRVLVIVDNCEHVVDTCAKLAELVERSCPAVRLLATSREPLGVDGERVYRLRPLSVPEEGATAADDLAGCDAVELFVERARAQDDSFVLDDQVASLVASICRRLDGVPFAIELAAARLSTMSLEELNKRLDQRFRLLTGGSRNALARQRTLQAALDWSYELLNSHEREVLCRLSVFTGSFDLGAAEAVCADIDPDVFETDDAVASLVNKSLVTTERSSTTLRYRLLETIRQYAGDQFMATAGDAGTSEALRAHAAYYLRLSEMAEPELEGRDQGAWAKRLDQEWGNLRAALAYYEAEPGRTSEVLLMVSSLWRYAWTRCLIEPAIQLQSALASSDPVPPEIRMGALAAGAALFTFLLGLTDKRQLETGRRFGEEALVLARRFGDVRMQGEVLSLLAACAYLEEDSEQATRLAEEALAIGRAAGDPRVVGLALGAHVSPGRADRRELLLESLECFRQVGDDFWIFSQLYSLAGMDLRDERFESGRRHVDEALEVGDKLGSSWFKKFAWALQSLFMLLQGEPELAAPVCRKALLVLRRTGQLHVAAFVLFQLNCCIISAGDYQLAARLWGAHEVLDAEAFAAAPSRTFEWTGPELRLREEYLARLVETIGEDEFERLRAAGRGLSSEEAVDLALGRPSAP